MLLCLFTLNNPPPPPNPVDLQPNTAFLLGKEQSGSGFEKPDNERSENTAMTDEEFDQLKRDFERPYRDFEQYLETELLAVLDTAYDTGKMTRGQVAEIIGYTEGMVQASVMQIDIMRIDACRRRFNEATHQPFGIDKAARA
jgi:hypothetical protein